MFDIYFKNYTCCNGKDLIFTLIKKKNEMTYLCFIATFMNEKANLLGQVFLTLLFQDFRISSTILNSQ